MAESAKFLFKNADDNEEAIDRKDLIAVVPNPDGFSSLLYVKHNAEDETAPPRVIVTKALTDPSSPYPGTADRETHIVVSTGSGTNKADAFFQEAVKPVLATIFPKAHSNFQIYHTESESSILNLTNDIFFPRANAGSGLRIIIVSGDGGIIDLVNGLLAKSPSTQYKAPQVILLPLGTANALYHSINAGKENTWGLSNLAAEDSRPLPIFTASFSSGARLLAEEARSELELPKDPQTQYPILHGAVVCSWGMHASLVADSDTSEYRKFGVERFKMAAKEALYPTDGSLPHAYKAKVYVLKDDAWKTLELKEHMYVLATMVSNLEKPFTISPASKPLDGSLHLVHFGPTDGDEAMRIMGLAYQGGKHVEDPAVLYEAIDGLRIEFQGKEEDARWRRICVDGKIVRVEKDGWVELRKEPRRVLDVVTT
ncbi:ATP-NAD kinase-like domain-containing protein [Massariosphaeria phaeospora]|uniref:ATP-NAD kinase-like domain-containing protein n=1 Tax=Massariosphaeria phaeospora TaxID=100035 RepID=A0A7C8I8L7_9PLEO|nr:ATP-NAD kinase-like domain-containing protein [Massariosphaeria phaeospora]